MSIDCCKSYVGKQIIGLLPSGGALNKCLWFGTVDDRTTSLEFQNPSSSWTGDYWVNGVDGQTNYQPQLGVFSNVYGYDETLFVVWSLEDEGAEPVGWTGNGNPVTWERYDCDTTKGCFKTQGIFSTSSTSLYVTEIALSSGYTFNLSANGLDAYTIDDPVILTYLQGIFGGDAIITVNVNYGVGTYSIEIDNVYNLNGPVYFGLFDGDSYVAQFNDCTRPKCIAWADNIITAENCVFNAFNWSINNTIFPTNNILWEIGVDIQSQYQLDAGGGVVTVPGNVDGCGGFLWSLEDDPIGTNWQVTTTDTIVTNPILWNGQSCDLSQACYEVDMVGVNLFDTTNDFTFTSPNGNVVLQATAFQLNDSNFIIFLQSIFGGQATITLTDNVTSVYIKIENCYTAIHPVELQIPPIGTFQFTACTP